MDIISWLSMHGLAIVCEGGFLNKDYQPYWSLYLAKDFESTPFPSYVGKKIFKYGDRCMSQKTFQHKTFKGVMRLFIQEMQKIVAYYEERDPQFITQPISSDLSFLDE